MAGSMNTYFARFQRRRLRSSWLYKIKVASSSGGPGEPHTFGESWGKAGKGEDAAAMTSGTSISTPFASCQVIGQPGSRPTGGESL